MCDDDFGLFFFEYNCPEYFEFENKLVKTFDEDCFNMAKEFCLQICNGYVKVLELIVRLTKIVEENKNLNQKDFAEKILNDYKEFSNFLFSIRKFNELNKEQVRKLLEKELDL